MRLLTTYYLGVYTKMLRDAERVQIAGSIYRFSFYRHCTVFQRETILSPFGNRIVETLIA